MCLQRCRFFGGVNVGEDASITELRAAYSGVVLSYGCADDNALGVPGELLDNVYVHAAHLELILTCTCTHTEHRRIYQTFVGAPMAVSE